eukprot:scaffold112649_cov17-Tisochrysis_lutea.AAC.1
MQQPFRSAGMGITATANERKRSQQLSGSEQQAAAAVAASPPSAASSSHIPATASPSVNAHGTSSGWSREADEVPVSPASHRGSRIPSGAPDTSVSRGGISVSACTGSNRGGGAGPDSSGGTGFNSRGGSVSARAGSNSSGSSRGSGSTAGVDSKNSSSGTLSSSKGAAAAMAR